MRGAGALQVEGTCNGKYGFILCVMQSTEMGKGLIREGVGSAVFNVKYSCVAFLPHKGEVLDTIVTSVNKVRRGERGGDCLGSVLSFGVQLQAVSTESKERRRTEITGPLVQAATVYWRPRSFQGSFQSSSD